MDKSKKFFYENVIPTVNDTTVKVNFKDNSDLIFEEQKNTKIKLARKINNFFFLIVSTFLIFIMISLYKTYFSEVGKKNFNKVTALIDRGRILDRNGEIIATNIKTKDLYIDTRKVLDNYDLKRKLREIFPEKNNFFFDKIFNKKHYIRIKQHLTPNEINQLRKIGDPAIQFHNSVKRIYIHHNLFSHLTGFKSSNITSKVEKNLNDFLEKGNDLSLSVDLRVQSIVHEELSNSLKKYDANSAVTIIIDVNNGDILSLVSLPDFDPNHPTNIKAFTENNLAT